jgi:hypothetical protein
MNRLFNTSMKFSAPIRILVISSLVLLLQASSYADPADDQGRDAPILSQQTTPTPGDSTVPVSPEITAQLSSSGEGSVPGAAGPKAKSANGAPPTVKPSSPSSAAGKKDAGTKKNQSIYRQPSVLDRFREFRGARTPGAFLALFDQKQSSGFRQDPPVVLTDGKAIVRLLFVSAPEWDNISDVSLTGARLVAAIKDPEATNTWIIEALPEKGTDEVTMAILQGGVLMVFPVAVAPQVNIDLNKSGHVTEEDFRLFLKERGTPRSPAYDLNGDGVRDFRDDYLFTANYLALNPAPEPKPSPAPSTPAKSADEDENLYETGTTVEPLPPEVEPEEGESPGR